MLVAAWRREIREEDMERVVGSGLGRSHGAEVGKLDGDWDRVCTGWTTTSDVHSLTKNNELFCLDSAEVNDCDISVP